MGGEKERKIKTLSRKSVVVVTSVCLLLFCEMGMGKVEQVHCQDGDKCAEEAGMGREGSWVSSAQADARIRVLCWKKTCARLRVGEQDRGGTVSQHLEQDESTQPDMFTISLKLL